LLITYQATLYRQSETVKKL